MPENTCRKRPDFCSMLEKTLSLAKAEQKVEDGDVLVSPEALGNRFSPHIAKITHMHLKIRK